jgi:glycosyltransferase involved in cell wall biosynthesis
MNFDRAAARAERTTVVLLSSAHPARDKRVFEKVARALSEMGLEVTHVCPAATDESVGEEIIDRIRIVRYRRKTGLMRRALGVPRLIGHALREGGDVYHCNEVDSWLAGVVAARWRRAKVVFDVHEHYPSIFTSRHLPPFLRKWGGLFIRLLYRALTPVTDGLVFAKSTVEADFPNHPLTALVRNLPPLRLLATTAEIRPSSGDEILAVHTGVLRRARGWPQMLDALVLASSDISLRIVGGFTDGSGNDFDRRVTELGLTERVEIEPWLPFDAAFDQLRDADIGLILFQPGVQNHVFASPHKLFDYMLAGLPVIAPAFGVEIAQIVDRHDCGILVDPSDPADIADALERLAGDNELRRRMGERGRRAVIEELNWERESECLLDLYRRLGVPLEG